jgi:CheY-like chemotaxis protein
MRNLFLLADGPLPFTIANNGSEAWTFLQRSDCPELFLLDWVLPDIDGVESINYRLS